MTLITGTHLGPYEILSPIGAGGMGEVYRARDGRLGREVAIKILPEAVRQDGERLARFRREAQVLASLNHPHIAAIHGLEESGGVEALVLELVEGETLAERLARGPLPLDEALEVARQIAEALESAHEKGIVHRDLKPANVKLTPDGNVKVLDFGLAKALIADSSAPDVSVSPTLTAAATQAGVVIGTAAYMSPEQARGRSVDRRSDIWAFGVVLWEMLTGRRLFEGETVSDTLAAVLRQDIDWAALPSGTPSPIRRLLARCIERDPRRRLHDIADARLEVDAALREPEPVPGAEPNSPRPSRRAAWLVPWAVALALAALALWQAFGGRREERPLVSLSVALPEGMKLEPQLPLQTQQIAISPDGRRIAFFARAGEQGRIFIRELSTNEIRPIVDAPDGGDVFFSPDGEWIGFATNGKLQKVAAGGGVPVELAPAGQGRGAAWGRDGTIVFAPTVNSPLFRLPDRGGQPQAVTRLDTASGERTHRWPEILPDGDTVLFTVGTQDKPGDYADARIDAVSLSTGKRHTVYRGASYARYAAGHLLLARNDSLLAARFDAGKAELRGAPSAVLQKLGGDLRSGVAFFGVARDGTLAWITGLATTGSKEIVWIDREGHVEPSGIPPGPFTDVALSPDGSRLAYSAGPGGGANLDIWIADLKQGSPFQLTSDGKGGPPLWTPDGRDIVYPTPAGDAMIRRSADGRGPPEVLWKPSDRVPLKPDAFTSDGSKLLLTQFGLPTRGNILLLPLSAGATPGPFIQTPAEERDAALSPDGHWVAYAGFYAPGNSEIYVQAFPEVAGRWQVSRRGGSFPRWSKGSGELFYLRGDELVAVTVELRPTFASGPERTLFRVERLTTQTENDLPFDVAPDGQRFVFIADQAGQKASPRIDVALRWAEHLSETVR